MFDLVRNEYSLGCVPPETLERAILDYARKKHEAKINVAAVKNTVEAMFTSGQVVDYSKIVEEYLLYYFIVNLFKIWKPLIDLSERKQLSQKLNVLEIGCGPGSSTFGLIEFYKFMAIEQPQIEFELSITLVEQYAEFLNAFEYLFNAYKSGLPDNLKVTIAKEYNQTVSDSIDFVGGVKFDLIYASNMFNSNEKFGIQNFISLMTNLKPHLENNGSIVIIEPADQKYSMPFLSLRNELQNDGVYTLYSPCNNMYAYPHILCDAFSMARVHLRQSDLLDYLKRERIITKTEHLVHNFQYAVFRKDELTKYDIINKKHDKLCEISSKTVGDRVNIYANIITSNEKSDGAVGLLLCDGTLTGVCKVWLNLSSNDIKQHKLGIKIIRGERIVLKDAIVDAGNRIGVDTRTKMEVFF